MVAPVQLCLWEPFPAHLNPLDLLWSSGFPSGEPVLTLLFTPDTGSLSRGSAVLLCAHRTEDEAAGPEEPGPVRLRVSGFFLRHFGLRTGTAGTVRLLPAVPLSKVVLGARSRQSWRFAASEPFCSGLQRLASSTEQRVLVREGEPLLLPLEPPLGQDGRLQQLLLDLVVVQCCPVRQGMICGTTSIVLSDWGADRSQWESQAGSATAQTKLLVSDFAHFSSSLSRGLSLLETHQLSGSDWSGFLQALECRVEVRVPNVWPTPRAAGGQDRDSAVFVSKQLLLKLGLFNHEWIFLSPLNLNVDRPESLQAQRAPGSARGVFEDRGDRLAKVVALDVTQSPELNDSVALISATHWFNLMEGEELPAGTRTLRVKRQTFRPPRPDIHLSHSHSLCRSATPPRATQLHLRPVAPSILGCHALLSHHFTTPRLVHRGDIVSVRTHNHPELLDPGVPQRLLGCTMLHYEVSRVCGDQDEEEGFYLADTEHTSLYTGSATCSRVPYCGGGGIGESLWEDLPPAGPSAAVDQISSIIHPHLHHSSALGSCRILLHGDDGVGKITAVRATCRRLHLHLVKVDCVSVCAETAAACEVKVKAAFLLAEGCQPCVLLLRNLQYLVPPAGGGEEDSRVQAALCQLLSSTDCRVVVVATVRKPLELSAAVMAAFVHQVALESPSAQERKKLLSSLTAGLPLGGDVSVDRLVKLTAGLALADLKALLADVGRSAHVRLLHSCLDRQQEAELCASGVTIQWQDVAMAMDRLQDAKANALGAPKIPSVRWQEVGGLQEVKQQILDTVQLPLQVPELLGLGLRRTGLLLYGPPGTGKTLLAKAVATECSMTFMSVKGPELINMYVGQSEENIRQVFSRARAAAPCVVFFDELDSLAPSRGRSGDSAGVMDRVVSQLVAELDALHSSSVFVVGATNRPDLLDQALLRPGRLDKLLYVGLNSDRVSQLQVLNAVASKFCLGPGVSLETVVDRCPLHVSGADLYSLCSGAMMAAVKRRVQLITEGLEAETSPLVLSSDDFLFAVEMLHPSVPQSDALCFSIASHNAPG